MSAADEQPKKIVGKRTAAPDGLIVQSNEIDDAIAWRKALGGVRIPKGVYRFKTHEEADAWLWKMITRPRKD